MLAFGELKQEEYTVINNVFKVIEHTLKRAFEYHIMNY
jgi:hypothetical protein